MNRSRYVYTDILVGGGCPLQDGLIICSQAVVGEQCKRAQDGQAQKHEHERAVSFQ
jgi:hypothetical protein